LHNSSPLLPPPENVKFAVPKILLPQVTAWFAITVAPVPISGLLQTMNGKDTPTKKENTFLGGSHSRVKRLELRNFRQSVRLSVYPHE